MIDSLNVLVNIVLTATSAMFYLMIFSNITPAFDASRMLSTTSYWMVRVGLSFFVAGSLFAVVTTPHVTFNDFVRNVGMAVLFSWAVVYHAERWGLVRRRRS
jgi:hypothetical protein